MTKLFGHSVSQSVAAAADEVEMEVKNERQLIASATVHQLLQQQQPHWPRGTGMKSEDGRTDVCSF